MSVVKKSSPYGSDSEESSPSIEDNDNSSEEDLYEQSENKEDTGQSLNVNDKSKKDSKQTVETTKQSSVTFVCNALSDYESKEAGELSFEKGEMLTVIDISRKDGWWKAKNSDGVQGLVPSTFLKVPDHMSAIVSKFLKSSGSKEIHFWNSLRSSLRKAQAYNTAIRTFGSIGLPLGFRESYLSTKLKEDKSYSAEAFLFPKLNDSGLSFEDMQWEVSPTLATGMQLKPITTVLQKVIQLVALRQIMPPPSGYEVTSRHVHMCLHDGNDIQSNIHTTKAIWDEKNPKIWMFSTKIAVDGSCLEEGQIFIRSNKLYATLGILFELCISYKKKDSPDLAELSCGWAFMRLLNDSGVPVKSRTKILKIHNSVPFRNNPDATSASLSSLQKLMNRNKQPRMVISISSPKRSSSQQICYLPSTVIGPVSSIPLIALYRKIISYDLLQRTSFDSADLIQSPFLTNFPRIFNQPDLIDFFRNAWAERLKNDKNHSLRSEDKKLDAFCSLFMETAFLILNSCSLPPYCLGDIESEQERKVKLCKIASSMNSKDHGALALSADLEFKPLSVQMLSTYVI